MAPPTSDDHRGGTSAAGCLLIELPLPFRWKGFEDEAFGRRPRDYFEPGAPVGDEGIARKLAVFGCRGDSLRGVWTPTRLVSLPDKLCFRCNRLYQQPLEILPLLAPQALQFEYLAREPISSIEGRRRSFLMFCLKIPRLPEVRST
jgi:hypothetical protein